VTTSSKRTIHLFAGHALEHFLEGGLHRECYSVASLSIFFHPDTDYVLELSEVAFPSVPLSGLGTGFSRTKPVNCGKCRMAKH
jgi:hypothetical protein